MRHHRNVDEQRLSGARIHLGRRDRAAAILRAEGATVIFTRPNDTSIGPCITVRAQIGNDAHAMHSSLFMRTAARPAGDGFFVIANRRPTTRT